MDEKEKPTVSNLRQMAEAKMQDLKEASGPLSADEARKIIHELQVHQIELEMQNEELRQAQLHLAESHAQFINFYDLSPLGYLTLNEQGIILEANLTVAEQLGTHRSDLLNQPLAVYIPADGDKLYFHLQRVFQEKNRHTCELKVQSAPGREFYARLDSTFQQDSLGKGVCRAALIDVSELKRAEEALRESEARFKLLYEQAPLPYQSLDERGNFIEVNQTWLDSLGYTKEEVIGKNFSDFLHPDWIDHFKENFPRFKALGEVLGVEFEMVKKDGSMVLVSFHGKIGRDVQGFFQQTHCIFEDITASKRIAHIMEARLRLLEYANTHSLDELLTATLDEIEALTGSTIGFYHFLEPDQQTVTLQNWSTNTLKNMCVAAGKGRHYDIAQAGVWVDCIYERRPVIHNDYHSLPHRKGIPEGHAPVVREVVVPILRGAMIKAVIGVGNKSTDYNNSDIEIVSQLGDLSWDIVEGKRAEEALRDSEEKFRLAMEAAQDGLWDWNVTTGAVYYSPGWSKILGFQPYEVAADVKFWESSIHPDDVRATLKFLEDHLAGKLPSFRAEHRLLTKEGSYKWVLGRGQVVRRSSDGKPLRAIGTMTDISERKRAEKAIQASLAEKEVLLKEIYHRTKNNLQVVCSLLNLQSARFTDPQLLQVFQDTASRIRSMALVHQKLYQSKDLSHIDLQDYIKDLANFLLMNYQTEAGGISLHLDLQSVIVNIDTAMPCGLMINELISNAIKYAFPGGRKGTISLFLSSTADGDIELRVADDGVGLGPELDVWNSESLGLRLAINLAQNQLQGKLEIRREPGTEFRIIFRELDYKPRI